MKILKYEKSNSIHRVSFIIYYFQIPCKYFFLPLPQHRCHRLSEIRTGDPLDISVAISTHREFTNASRPAERTGLFFGSGLVRSINRTGDVNHSTSHLQSSAQSACACCQINRQTHTAARQTVRLLVETFPDCCPPRAADRNVLNHLTAAVAAVRRASKTCGRAATKLAPVTRLNPGDFRNSRYHRSSLNFGLSETAQPLSLSLSLFVFLSSSLRFSVAFKKKRKQFRRRSTINSDNF